MSGGLGAIGFLLEDDRKPHPDQDASATRIRIHLWHESMMKSLWHKYLSNAFASATEKTNCFSTPGTPLEGALASANIAWLLDKTQRSTPKQKLRAPPSLRLPPLSRTDQSSAPKTRNPKLWHLGSMASAFLCLQGRPPGAFSSSP